ncbi:uncharacterized protein METZ01_LOCUS423337 [marine metagenome]|uniref:DUF2190 domain-containing protein n=1 Tax=marine metagenome TaxID=408172 RepID=A0A382XHR4_9ZZZZ
MAATIGQLARSTGIEIVSFNVAAATTLTVGKLVALDASGNAVAATNSVGTIARGLFVAIETVDNSAGSAGDLQVRCAIGNTYVYCEAGGAIKVGEAVKADANSDCVVATAILGAETHVGRFIAHENESVSPTDAVDGDVIIVRLGF